VLFELGCRPDPGENLAGQQSNTRKLTRLYDIASRKYPLPSDGCLKRLNKFIHEISRVRLAADSTEELTNKHKNMGGGEFGGLRTQDSNYKMFWGALSDSGEESPPDLCR